MSQAFSIAFRLNAIGNDQTQSSCLWAQQLQVAFEERYKKIPPLMQQLIDAEVPHFVAIAQVISAFSCTHIGRVTKQIVKAIRRYIYLIHRGWIKHIHAINMDADN